MDNSESLPFLTTPQRLAAYQMIVDGCNHIWSKGQMQTEKALEALNALIPLTQQDPLFLAHLTAYVVKNMKENKDLQIFVTYANSLNSGDGTPFSPGSNVKKPNLRLVSAAAVQNMDVKVAGMLLQLARTSYGVNGVFNESRHFPTVLKTAFQKYLKYREANPPYVEGIKKAGLSRKYRDIYRGMQRQVPDEIAATLRWNQEGRDIEMEQSISSMFESLSDLQIARKIREEKLSPLTVFGALPRKMSPVIAVSILEQSTGNQAVINRRLFEDSGVLDDPEVMALYERKIASAKTALDRVETVAAEASEAIKHVMRQARATSRQAQTAGIGKVFVHLDTSGSMDRAIDFAKEKGAIIAECVNNPSENFRWATFNTIGRELALPEHFTADEFQAILFGTVAGGGTDAFANYGRARQFGADVDVFVTDQGHNVKGSYDPSNVNDFVARAEAFHASHPTLSRPKAVVIVDFVDGYHVRHTIIKDAYERMGIPVTVLKPETLTQSALVIQAVKTALLGPSSVVDDIMATELLKLPEYYFTI